jgi:predicted nucleic acid-binding Zn ribbon protein
MEKSENRYHSPRKAETTPLKDAIDELLKVYQLKGKSEETYLITSWRQLMGNAIANRTTKIYIQDNKLFLQINSAPLKNELMMAKAKILDILNKEVETLKIEDVIFV